MYQFAEFEIIGNVVSITSLEKVLKVKIASNYNYKDKTDAWVNDAKFNEVSIFDTKLIDWIKKSIAKGDQVIARGSMGQNSYENKDGDIIYTQNNTATLFRLISKKQEKSDNAD